MEVDTIRFSDDNTGHARWAARNHNNVANTLFDWHSPTMTTWRKNTVDRKKRRRCQPSWRRGNFTRVLTVTVTSMKRTRAVAIDRRARRDGCTATSRASDFSRKFVVSARATQWRASERMRSAGTLTTHPLP